jgi:uncharacterized Zn finger protein (UPF0148 family)
VPRAFYNEGGNYVKTCTLCKETLPVEKYYKHNIKTGDGYRPRCGKCVELTKTAANRRRAKKRKQRTHKLNETHIKWIKEQQYKLSTRGVAKAFSKRFWAMKLNASTVHRIFTGQIHAAPNKKDDTLSVYDMLEQAAQYSGSIEEYIEELDAKKIKF